MAGKHGFWHISLTPKIRRSNRLRCMNGQRTALDEADRQKAGYRPIFNSGCNGARNKTCEAPTTRTSKTSREIDEHEALQEKPQRSENYESRLRGYKEYLQDIVMRENRSTTHTRGLLPCHFYASARTARSSHFVVPALYRHRRCSSLCKTPARS